MSHPRGLLDAADATMWNLSCLPTCKRQQGKKFLCGSITDKHCWMFFKYYVPLNQQISGFPKGTVSVRSSEEQNLCYFSSSTESQEGGSLKYKGWEKLHGNSGESHPYTSVSQLDATQKLVISRQCLHFYYAVIHTAIQNLSKTWDSCCVSEEATCLHHIHHLLNERAYITILWCGNSSIRFAFCDFAVRTSTA